MPRPGCVWTHVLLLPPIFFEGVPNLNVLKEFVRRPTTREDRSTYNEPIAIQIRTNAVVKFSSAPGFRKIVEEILAALYGKRSEEHTSELQSLMRISYAVYC